MCGDIAAALAEWWGTDADLDAAGRVVIAMAAIADGCGEHFTGTAATVDALRALRAVLLVRALWLRFAVGTEILFHSAKQRDRFGGRHGNGTPGN